MKLFIFCSIVGRPYSNFVNINITSESIEEFRNDDIFNPNGLAYDGQYFWTYEIVFRTIIKFNIKGFINK